MEADLTAELTPELTRPGDAVFAPLPQFGLLAVTGEEARGFLHAQLSNDIEHLPPDAARRAGYCSAKGRLLASLVVIPSPDGFLLQLSRDLAAAIAKRLTMYVLRSKVKVIDASDASTQFGVWGRDAPSRLHSAGLKAPEGAMKVERSGTHSVLNLGDGRLLVLGSPETEELLKSRFTRAAPELWTLADLRAGLPLVTLPTQDQFVPQMANFELIGGIDFKKGCYPGQEIVARTQYLGKLKRRMYRGEIEGPQSTTPLPGQDLFGAAPQAIGTIVNAAPRPEGGMEFLAVLQSSAVEQGDEIHVGTPEGPVAHIASLPYSL